MDLPRDWEGMLCQSLRGPCMMYYTATWSLLERWRGRPQAVGEGEPGGSKCLIFEVPGRKYNTFTGF